MHGFCTVIELALVKDDHSVVQIDPGFQCLLHFSIASPGIDPTQLCGTCIHVAAIGRTNRTLAVIDQRYIIDRCVCFIHVVECR